MGAQGAAAGICLDLRIWRASHSPKGCCRQRRGLLPIVSHNFINVSNISNILRYLYGRTHLINETTP